MKQPRLTKNVLGIQESLTNFVYQAGPDSERSERESAERFVLLVLLAALLVPAFIVQFSLAGQLLAAQVMALTMVAMATSMLVYKFSKSLPLARDLFLGALYAFITWETFYFDSIYSPGLIWYAAMPVASVLLGSYVAGLVWLLIGSATAFVTLNRVGGAWNQSMHTAPAEFLYVFSVVFLAIAIFIFMLMIDVARARAYRDLRAANAAIKVRAETDELTGLLNRGAFRESLSKCLDATSGAKVAILLLDLDRFKEINDTHGHDVGDLMIIRVSQKLQELCQNRTHAVARLGGDEFAILVNHKDAKQLANTLAHEILEAICQPFDIEGRNCVVGVSVGMASVENIVKSSEVLRRADVAMYAAKKDGTNRVCHYSPSMDVAKHQRMKMAASLADGMNSRRFEVHYQPVVDSATRKIVAVEALARWRDDSGKNISPEEFIPVAEESGLINELGLKVLEKACQQAMAWPGTRLAVNISPVQFSTASLVSDILSILDRTGFSPHLLELEVTEGTLISKQEQARPQLLKLQDQGINIALDDFGTGFSSIGYLRRYRFDRLKIDKSLVEGVLDDQTAQSIIHATALMARSLSMNLTAEGVETEDQAKLLHLAGCQNLQGYLFGKPQPHGEITLLLREGDCETEQNRLPQPQ